MSTYTFPFPGRDAGKTVTVFDSTNTQVTSGATDSNAVLTVSLPYGDYYAIAPDGQYVRGGVDSNQSAEAVGLPTVYAARPLALARNTFGALGDSITAGDATMSPLNPKDAWPIHCESFSAGKLRRVAWSAVAGETTAQIFARVALALDDSPSMLITCAGVNDARAYALQTTVGTDDDMLASVFSTKNGIPAIANAALAAGALPVFTTLPPRENSGYTAQQVIDWRRLVLKINARLRHYCAVNHFPLVDLYGVLADPTTGGYKAGLGLGDGTHPGPNGHRAIGQAVAEQLLPILSPQSLILTSDALDTLNLVGSNGVFTANNGFQPTGWSSYMSPNGFTAFSTPVDSGGFGNRFRCTQSAGSALTGLKKTVTIIAGHKYRFSGRFNTDGGVRIMADVYLAPNNHRAFDIAAGVAVPDGYWSRTFVAEASGTAEVDLIVYGGTGIVEFWRPTLIDLTALGIS